MPEQILRRLEDLTIEECAYVPLESFIGDESGDYYIRKDSVCSDVPFDIRVELINCFGGDLAIYMSHESQQQIPTAESIDLEDYRPVLYVGNGFIPNFEAKVGKRGTQNPVEHIQNKIGGLKAIKEAQKIINK